METFSKMFIRAAVASGQQGAAALPAERRSAPPGLVWPRPSWPPPLLAPPRAGLVC